MALELWCKHFLELTNEELWEIYKLRVSVFVVEQNCPYQEIDEWDKVAYHLTLREDGKIRAYLRVLPKNSVFEDASLGRVIAVVRHCGLGTEIVKQGIKTAKEKFGANRITIEAQTYALSLYEKLGFRCVSKEFLEDGIPHVKMQLDFPEL